VLQEPVLLEDPSGSLRRCERVAGLATAGEDGSLGKVWERQSVHGRLLGAECRRDRRVKLRAPQDRHERQRRRPQLLRVVLHGRALEIAEILSASGPGVSGDTPAMIAVAREDGEELGSVAVWFVSDERGRTTRQGVVTR
jgi:hypothetical protein